MVVEDILTYGNKLGGLMHFILSKAKCFPRISAKQRMALFFKDMAVPILGCYSTDINCLSSQAASVPEPKLHCSGGQNSAIHKLYRDRLTETKNYGAPSICSYCQDAKCAKFMNYR